MASADKLLEFLLEAIALCGSVGASSADFLRFIDDFYADRAPTSTSNDRDDHASSKPRKPTIDRLFQERIWQWVTKSPDVSVGAAGEGDQLSLSEFEARNSRSQVFTQQPQQEQSIPQAGAPVETDMTGIADLPPASRSASTPSTRPGTPSGPPSQGGLRVYATEGRMWLALTGHAQDASRLFPPEFELLSIIASRRENGLIQSDLVRLSGQDKRTVPKRTDALREKGYIEKRPVLVKKQRTSLLTLCKFLPAADQPRYPLERGQPNTAAVERQDTLESIEHSGKIVTYDELDEVVDVQALLLSLFSVLKEQNLIAMRDLKQKLGFQLSGPCKVLSRTIRKMESIGCVKRVRAASEYTARLGFHHPSLKLLRSPTEADLRRFGAESLSAHVFGAAETENDDDSSFEGPAPNLDATNTIGESSLLEISQVVPQWTPDRNLANMLFTIVDSAGSLGVNNKYIQNALFGPLFKRPTENLVDKLVARWQQSQPPHLRHLSLIRDTAMDGHQTFYVHYTYQNYKAMVDRGEATWAAVRSMQKISKDTKVLDAETSAKVDEYGFPLMMRHPQMLEEGEATLMEGVIAAGPWPYAQHSGEPIAVQDDDGDYALRHASNDHTALNAEVTTTKRPIGRPRKLREVSETEITASKPRVLAKGRGMGTRKYLKGTEDFWRHLRIQQLKMTGKGAALHYKRTAEEAGFEDDPVGYCYAKRPRLFDQTLLRAIQKHLPVPEEPEDINGKWVENITKLLDRSNPGLYVSPKGNLETNPKAATRTGQLAVFRLPRLAELDLPQDPPSQVFVHAATPLKRKRKVIAATPAVRFLTTSAAHTFPTFLTSMKSRPVKKARIASPAMAVKRRPAKTAGTLPFSTPGGSLPANTAAAQYINQAGSITVKGPKLGYFEVDERTHSVLSRGPTDKSRQADPAQPQLTSGSRSRSSSLDSQRTTEIVATHRVPPRPRTPPVTSPPEDAALVDAGQTEASPLSPVRDQTQARRPKEQGDAKGGSVAASRRKIILDLLETCGGVYPYDVDIWRPFHTAWRKLNKSSKPEKRTIKATVKSMVDTGKIKQLTFSHKDAQGVMVMKQMLTYPGLAHSGEEVIGLRKKMIAAGTKTYIPPEADVDDDLRRSATPVRIGTYQHPEIDDDALVVLHKKPVAVQNLGSNSAPAVTVTRGQKKSLKCVMCKKNSRICDGKSPCGTCSRELYRCRYKDDEPTPSLHHEYKFITTAGPPPPSEVGNEETPGAPSPELGIDGESHYETDEDTEPENGSPRSGGEEDSEDELAAGPAQAMEPGMSPEAPVQARRKRGESKKESVLPDSLEDILGPAHQRRRIEPVNTTAWAKFQWEIATVKSWETRNEQLLSQSASSMTFLNHSVGSDFVSAGIKSKAEVREGQVGVAQTAQEEKPEVSKRKQGRAKKAVPPIEEADAEGTPGTGRKGLRRAPRPTAKKRDVEEMDLEEDGNGQSPKKRRRKNAISEPTPRRLDTLLSEARGAEQIKVSTPAGPSGKIRRPRGPQFLKNLPEEVVYRMMTAILVVRTLTGGLDRNIDWALVMQCLPDQDEKFVKERWRTILSKRIKDLDRMTEDLQERYLLAYENDELPKIDYDELDAYDWNLVVEWAMKKLRNPLVRPIPDLPSTRQELNDTSVMRLKEPQTPRDLFAYINNITVPMKKALISHAPFAIKRSMSRPKVTISENQETLEKAKTWIRAITHVEHKDYNPQACRAKLGSLSDHICQMAVKSLVAEKVIEPKSKTGGLIERNYEITRIAKNALTEKRNVGWAQIKQASQYKLYHLDVELKKHGIVEYDYLAEDGDTLAILNLLAQGCITLTARDPPKTKWGFLEGYHSKTIDQKEIRFAVDIRPVEGKYIYGSVFMDNWDTFIDKPKGEMEQGGKIPLWYDLQGNFSKEFWEWALGAMLGCCIQRPGVSAEEMSETFKPALWPFEIDLAMEWMQRLGLAHRTGEIGGWEVKGFWWMVLSDTPGD